MDNNEILLKTLEKENKLIIENYKQKHGRPDQISIQQYKEVVEKYEQEKKEKQQLIEEHEQEKNERQQVVEKYEKEKVKNQGLEEESKMLRAQLDSILYSRSYKIVQKIKKILGRKQ